MLCMRTSVYGPIHMWGQSHNHAVQCTVAIQLVGNFGRDKNTGWWSHLNTDIQV